MVFCCIDNSIIICVVCGKSANKTKNQLTIEESKQWYVKRGDPVYCRKCLISEKLRLKQELETLKAINSMKNKKKDSKLKVSLRTIKDGKAWKKSDSFISAFKPSQKALEQTKKAEKRAQSKQDIKQNRKDNFSYDLKKELEVRRKLVKLERMRIERNSIETGRNKKNGPNRRKSSIVKFFKKVATNKSGGGDGDGNEQNKSPKRDKQRSFVKDGSKDKERRSSIVDFFKKFSSGKSGSSKQVDVGQSGEEEEEYSNTPVTSNNNSLTTTPHHSLDGANHEESLPSVQEGENGFQNLIGREVEQMLRNLGFGLLCKQSQSLKPKA